MNLNLNSMEKVLIENKNIIFKNLFGSWIDQIPWYLSRIVAKEQIYEAFLKLLEIWAKENKIVFFPPEQFYNKKLKTYLTPIKIKEKFKIWDISVEEIMAYMRNTIPKELHNNFSQIKSDEYCFGDFCPRIGWINTKEFGLSKNQINS